MPIITMMETERGEASVTRVLACTEDQLFVYVYYVCYDAGEKIGDIPAHQVKEMLERLKVMPSRRDLYEALRDASSDVTDPGVDYDE